jgi:benzoyl-CoA reductase/2-hydroxyglutaryl-CoA dehydratase subunit BcrC/BadD/HgdB
LIAHFHAKGVIYHTLRYCDPFTFKAKETKDILAAKGIPLLEIHTEYAGSDFEAIRTRIEAFVEILEAGAS